MSSFLGTAEVEVSTVDKLPDGSYLCEIVQAELKEAWQARHIALDMRIVAPTEYLDRTIRTEFPVASRSPKRLTSSTRELMAAVPVFVGGEFANTEILLFKRLVVTLVKPLLRGLSGGSLTRAVRFRPASTWRETATVLTLLPPVLPPVPPPVPPPVQQETEPQELDDIDGARFRQIKKPGAGGNP